MPVRSRQRAEGRPRGCGDGHAPGPVADGHEEPGHTQALPLRGPGTCRGRRAGAAGREQRRGSRWLGELQGPAPDGVRPRARPISHAPLGLRRPAGPPRPSSTCPRDTARPSPPSAINPAEQTLPGSRPASPHHSGRRGSEGTEAQGLRKPVPGQALRSLGPRAGCWGCMGMTRPRRAGWGMRGGQGEGLSLTRGPGLPSLSALVPWRESRLRGPSPFPARGPWALGLGQGAEA